MPEAGDPGAVTKRLVDRLPDRDPDVLDRVVAARLQVALGVDVQVEAAVAGDRVEHVVEKADPRRARSAAGAVELQRDADVGLTRGAGYLRGTAHLRRSMDSPWTGKPSARAIAAPYGARRAAASSVNDTRAMRRRNVLGESALANRAAPPVGRTWLEPAT